MSIPPNQVEEVTFDPDRQLDVTAAKEEALFRRRDFQSAMDLNLAWTRDELYER
jgi:hypothetical protein